MIRSLKCQVTNDKPIQSKVTNGNVIEDREIEDRKASVAKNSVSELPLVSKSCGNDVSSRSCPLRAGGHECGCLPVLAKLVMKHCVAHLDIAMFNAILRESKNEIPTDTISDPIVDSRVLPILAGDLSFGSGTQLKNSVCA
ncbi:unnamed protein product [Miscanthus lutarioriparius]|uniref:Uncharacterized protein n=1 Tax=Miscanthus lutarioriparius TaxID=422564 RepID=A0A811Q2B1_9POAL|nr:unnamed protein product [Miscanthus lutarioriparius]